MAASACGRRAGSSRAPVQSRSSSSPSVTGHEPHFARRRETERLVELEDQRSVRKVIVPVGDRSELQLRSAEASRTVTETMQDISARLLAPVVL